METQNIVTLAAAGLAFVASITNIVVSLYIARLGRFARQRWWERKVQAYADIIEALADLVYYHAEHYDAELEHHHEMSATHKAEIEEHWKKSYAALKKATAIGAFLISSDAEAALQTMWKEQGKGVHPGDFFGLVESSYVAAQNCLAALVEAAKADLKRP